ARNYLPPNLEADFLEVYVRPDAVPVDTTVKVKASLDEHRAEGQFHLRVVSTSAPPPTPEPSLAIEPPRELNVPQGQTVKCEVAVRREGYAGPVEVRLEEVPAQVECKAVAVPGEQETARLEVTAAADAPESEKEVRVVALAGKLRA